MQDPNSGKRIPGAYSKLLIADDKIDLYSDECILRIQAVDEHIIRFRYGPDNYFEPEFSYAIPKITHKSADFFRIEDADTKLVISTGALIIEILKEGLKLCIRNASGEIISEDEKGFHWEDFEAHGGNLVYYSRKTQMAEVFLGLGDKPTDTDLRGKVFAIWGTDMFGFEKDFDPLYKNIPFFIGLHHGMAYGIFMDNTFKSTFDFGHFNYKVMSFWADGGEMNFYFIYGPLVEDVVKRYTLLTGLPELPPIWALGYHQSKWSYYPEERVRDIAHELRKNHFPADGIFLDIDYMEDYKCFTINHMYFPDIKALIYDLKNMGIRLIPILDPGIKIEKGYRQYEECLENDLFCRRGDGPLLKASVWPGSCHFPDFTNPKARKWWKETCAEFLKVGFSGIWNDMNEPAVFGLRTFPFDVRHDYDGQPCSHRKAHNIYGFLMVKASYEGYKKAFPDKRPFMLTRSGFSGIQKYAATWTGDNLSKWEHIWLANLQCQRLSMSGISFCGSDIGGFIGEANAELMCRWMQLGVFHPFMRAHSSSDSGDKEPWLFPEPYVSIIRKFLQLRYSFLPYLYTLFKKYCTQGVPILMPVLVKDQDNLHTYYRKEEFFFGNTVLVCPVATPDAESRILYLPKGIWYDFWDHTCYEGNREIITYAPLDRIPLYIKAGSVLPMYPPIMHTGQIKELPFVYLNVYFAKQAVESEWYEDAGEGYDYLSGECSTKHFFTYYFNNVFSVEQWIEGSFQYPYRYYTLRIFGLENNLQKIICDGIIVNDYEISEKIVLNVPFSFRKIQFYLD